MTRNERIKIMIEMKEMIKKLIIELDKKDLEIARLQRIIKIYDKEWESNARH